jgi:hypothetical protein
MTGIKVSRELFDSLQPKMKVDVRVRLSPSEFIVFAQSVIGDHIKIYTHDKNFPPAPDANPAILQLSDRVFINAIKIPEGSLVSVSATDFDWSGSSIPTSVDKLWDRIFDQLIQLRILIADNSKEKSIDDTKSGHEKNIQSKLDSPLQPITDPIDQELWRLIQKDPSIPDKMLAQKMNMTRQALNTRRKTLQKMGYPVRGVSRQKR